jgi:xanthosine utilization system XapX-like protein
MSNNPNFNIVPLATWMKIRLLSECWPFISVLLVLLFTVFILPSIVNPVPIALPLLLGGVALLLGFQAVQRLRDLLTGVALVEHDVLESSRASSGQGKRYYFGQFKQLGRMRLVHKAHFQSHNGMQYRVIYSPASKIVWALEQVG